MKIATVKYQHKETAAIVAENGLVLLETLNVIEKKTWSTNWFDLLESGEFYDIKNWYDDGGKDRLKALESIPLPEASLAPLYRHPKKIWGIGMNYSDHPLAEITYADPVSFMKPDTSLIGIGDFIHIPAGSKNTTGEAELGMIIGKRCSHIEEDEASDYVAGFISALDMTEADIHAENHRYLTRAKSFDTFLSFGSYLLTNDEFDDVTDLKVSTVLNGEVKHTNVVSNMRYNPWFIVAFHSKVMTLLPGDIIITGSPGPVLLRDGDIIECQITGFPRLVNPVRNG